MIELIFIVCLLNDNGSCKTHSLLFQDIDLMTCMVQGQAQLAQWSVEHSGWEIRNWRCRWHDETRVEI